MRLKLCLLFVLIITFSWAQSGSTKTFTSSGTFAVPAGVTTISVQAWGGGGSGGGATGAPLLLGRGAAGGGGGAYASAAVSVTSGANLNVVVAGQTSGSTTNGTAGGNSTITGFESIILAAGGAGGAANNDGGNPAGGSGGTVAASAGTTRLAGVNGGNGNSWNLLGLLLSSGAGGAGGGGGGAGGAAVSGLILSNASGNGGSIAGGAGSGAINSASGASQIGGSGAAGKVIISYTCPTYTISSTSATSVCASTGSTSTITLTSGTSTLPVGNYVVTYNRSNPSATALTANLVVTTAGTGTFTATGLTTAGSSTITITKIESASCSSTISTNNTATVIVSPATVGGTVTGGTTIITGNTSGLLTLSGHTGSVVKWQSSVSPFTIWVDIANTTTTYTSGILTETTQFRAVVQSGSCAVANSAATTVTVTPLPTITLAASATAVCSGPAQNTTLSYSATTGSPVTYSIVWNSSPANSFVAVTDAALPASPITIAVPNGTSAGTYTGILTVKNIGGASSSGSNFTLTVNQTPFVGTAGVTYPICASSSFQNASMPYGVVTGNPIGYSIDWNTLGEGLPLTNQGQTPNSFILSGVINTVEVPAGTPPGRYVGILYYYNESCTDSLKIIMDIDPGTVGGAITGGTTINSGNTSSLLTLSGHAGSIIKWQSSVSPFTTWVDIANKTTTYTSGPLTETTQFRAVVQNGSCNVVNSEPATVTVNPLPTINLLSSAIGICSFNNGTSLQSTLGYAGTTGSPTTYSIVWSSSPANSFTPITDAVLPATPITLFLPAATAAGTYTGTLTVKNASGGVSSPGSVFTVTVDRAPSITTTGTIDPVTTSSNSQNATLAYSGITDNPTRYSIDWNAAANAALLTDQPATLFTFSPSGGVINTIVIPANVPAGTYSGTIRIISNGTCSQSRQISIIINEAPMITVAPFAADVCLGEGYMGYTPLFFQVISGDPVTYSIVWNSSPTNSFVPVTDEELPGSPMTINVPEGTAPGTYTGTFTAKNANGGVSVGSDFTVTVNEMPSITTEGIVGTSCVSNESEISYLDYSASTGAPTSYSIDWDDTANAALLTDVSETFYDFDPNGGNLAITIPENVVEGAYSGLFIVHNEFCEATYPITFTIIPGAVGGTVTGGTTIGSGSTSGLLTLSGQTATSVVRWESAVAPFTEWTEIENTETTYTSGPLTETTQFRAVVRKGLCPFAYSEPTTVTVEDLPTITLESSTISVCPFANGDPNVPNLFYTATTGNPTTYSIVWNSSPGSTLVNVTDEILTPDYITIIIPADTAVGTYSGILTVKNENGAVSNPGVIFTVTKNEAPTFTSTNQFNSLCTSTNSQTATLEYAATTGNPTQYSIFWGDDDIPDQENIPFTFAPGGGVLNIEIPAGIEAGTYSGQLVITNSAGCNWSRFMDLVINQAPTITIDTLAVQVCTSTNSQLVAVDYSDMRGDITKYSIDWPVESIEDQVDTPFAFTPGSGTINTIVVPANTPPATYGVELIFKNDTGCTLSRFVIIQISQTPATPVVSQITPQTDQSLGSVSLTGLPTSSTWELLMNPGAVVYNSFGSTETITNLQAGTYTFSVISRRTSSCYSEPVTVEIPYEAPPSITLASSAESRCVDINAGAQSTTLSYTETTGQPITYSIVWDSSPGNNFVNITDVALPTTPITIAIPAETFQDIYTGTLTVKNANGVVSTGSTFSLVINELPFVGRENTTEPINVCINKSQFSTFDYSDATSNVIGYSIDWNERANEASLADIPFTSYAFDPAGGSVPIEISANALAGLYSGRIVFYNQFCTDSSLITLRVNTCTDVNSKSVTVAQSDINNTGKTLQTDDNNSTENQISITSQNKVINVKTSDQNINNVLIFDVSGTLIYKKDRVGDSKLSIDNLRSGNQVLVVKVVLDNNKTETKKIIF